MPTTTSGQVIVNKGIKSVNASRVALGKGEVSELTGVKACPTSCVVAAGVPTRNRTQFGLTRVRSRRVAKLISEAWGTSFTHTPSKFKGEKDYPYVVDQPDEIVRLIGAFDGSHLDKLPTTTTHGFKTWKSLGLTHKDAILTIRSTAKKVATVELTTDEATTLVHAFKA